MLLSREINIKLFQKLPKRIFMRCYIRFVVITDHIQQLRNQSENENITFMGRDQELK